MANLRARGWLLVGMLLVSPGIPAWASDHQEPTCQPDPQAILFLEIEGVETRCEGWGWTDFERVSFFTESAQDNHVVVENISDGLNFTYRIEDGWQISSVEIFGISEQNIDGFFSEAPTYGELDVFNNRTNGTASISLDCDPTEVCNLFRMVVNLIQPNPFVPGGPEGFIPFTFFVRVDPPCNVSSPATLFLDIEGVDTKFSGWEESDANSVFRENHIVVPNFTSNLEFDYDLCDGWKLHEAELFRFNSELRHGNFLPPPDEETVGTGSIAFSDCEVPLAACNLFTLELVIYNSAGPYNPDTDSSITFTFYILEKSLTEPANVNVSLDLLEGQDIDYVNWRDDGIFGQSGQRWYQLPRIRNTQDQVNSLYQAFETDVRGTFYSSATFVPVFANTTFHATADDEIEIKIFDRTFTFDYCVEFLSLGNFVFFRPETELIPCFYDAAFPFIGSTNRFLRDPESREFFVTVFSVCNFENVADNMTLITEDTPRPCRNELGIRAALPIGASLMERDHRNSSTYGDTWEPVEDENLQGFGVRWEFDDENLNSRAWALNLDYTDSEGISRAIDINYIVVDNVTADVDDGFDNYDPGDAYIFGDNHEGFNSVHVQRRLRFDSAYTDFDPELQYEPIHVSWVKLPNQSNWVAEGYGPMRQNHTLSGWTSTSNTTGRIFSNDYFPMLDDEDRVYPVWNPIPQQGNGGFDQGGAPASDQNAGPGQQQSPSSNQNPEQSGQSSAPIVDTIVQPAPENQPPIVPLTPKTSLKISFENGRTLVEVSVPSKYVNAPTTIQKRITQRGKVVFLTLGRSWSHFGKETRDTSKAVMRFSFAGKLKPADLLRVKVRSVTVVKSYGDARPAWK